jgi:hypothetical protein
MTARRAVLTVCGLLMLGVAAWSVSVAAQKKDIDPASAGAAAGPDMIWRDPGDMASLDLLYGAGGKGHAPDPAGAFTFVKEDAEGTSPKFEVTDELGVEWKVKLGPESQSETAATRFLWAAGYFVDEDYYAADLTVKGLPVLRRGQNLVSAGGVVHGVRLKRKRITGEKLGDWDWFANPFLGQRELNGLRVMMSLLNNWDLKQANNAIYAVDGEHHYAISDLGATFGHTGNVMGRSKGVPRDYEGSEFIAKSTPDFVDFVLHSRPFFLGVFSASHYQERARMEKITRHIPRADARWLGQRLSMLTDDQIRDGFRAAGYEAADVETLTGTFRRRVAALEAL